jgi:predicted phage terminase large subunit-like protein
MKKAIREAIQGLVPRLNRYMPVHPTPPQAAFLLLPGLEASYGGAAGGGKSVALLMSALQYVDLPGYSALIVRQTYPMLSQPGGLIARSHEWLDGTDAVWSGTDHQWRFPSGATLTFRHMQDIGAECNFQGAEYHFIGIDEVSDFVEPQYQFLFSRLRRGRDSIIPVRMRAASNPYGPGLEWCHRRFILDGPRRGIVFIPAFLEDNPHIDRETYEPTLREVGPVVYRQLRYGDWNVRPQGGLFEASWFDDRFIEMTRVPGGLFLCRFWDLASSDQRRSLEPDYTSGVLLGRDREGELYVLDVVRERLRPLGVEQLLRRTADEDGVLAWRQDWRRAMIRVEQEPGSAGKLLIDQYSRNLLAPFDFRGVTPSGSKETRAAPVSARAEAGHVWLVSAAWNKSFLDELCAFPHASHDDQVDALAGAYAQLAQGAQRGHAKIKRAVFVERPTRRRSMPW